MNGGSIKKETFIAITKDKQYVVCTRDGKVLAGPFTDSEQAVIVRSDLGLQKGIELGKPSVMRSDTNGFEGYLLCIDDVPHIRFENDLDAQTVLGAFERGLVGLIYKRFLGGLGDLLALSGAAVMMSKLRGKLTLTSTAKYAHEFRNIFVNHPDIHLEIAFKDPRDFMDAGIEDNLLLHNEGIWIVDTHLDAYERIYDHFGIPYKYRWEACPVESSCAYVEQMPIPKGKYIFLHEDPSRGFIIDRKRLPDVPVYNPSDELSDTILAFKDVIENASELHVFDSCFFHLTECLNPKGKLFFHRYVKPYQPRYCDYKKRLNWEIVS